MKTIFTLIVVANLVTPVFGGKVDYESLVRVKDRKFKDSVRQQVWCSRQVDTREGKVQVDLMYSYENTNNPPEVRLVAHVDGRDYTVWKAIVDNQQLLPVEFSCEVSGAKKSIAFCFCCRAGRQILFYEIDIEASLKLMRERNSQGISSGWMRPDESEATNGLCQSIMVSKFFPNGTEYVKEIVLSCVGDKWFFSGVIRGHGISDAKVLYQYPVGGTGLTFIKKEPVPPASPGEKQCWQNLGAVQSFINFWQSGQLGIKPGTLIDTNSFYKECPKARDYKCPDGGNYDLGQVGGMPKCSVHGVSNLSARPE